MNRLVLYVFAVLSVTEEPSEDPGPGMFLIILVEVLCFSCYCGC